MKRLLVMNGQKLLQSEKDRQWVTDKVERAGELKPGIYNLYSAPVADIAKPYSGLVLHVDKDSLYLLSGKTLSKHEVSRFDKTPSVGEMLNISYDNGMAKIESISQKAGKKLAR